MEIWQTLALRVKRLISHNQFVLYLGVFIFSFLLYLMIQSSPTFLDPDSFYHLKMIKLTAEQGPIINFPWLQFTVLKDFYIDHHFLYHVLGVPFIWLLGDFSGYKFFTILLNSLFIVLCYALLKKEGIKYPSIYAFLILTTSGLLFRISLAKAISSSLILSFLVIYCLFRQKKWLLFFISWLYVWTYGGFLLAWVITGIYCLSLGIYYTWIEAGHQENKTVHKLARFLEATFSKDNLQLMIATISGVITGIIVNPYFPRNINFVWQQLVQIGIINYRGAVNVGGEWYPIKATELITSLGGSFILAILALAIFFAFIKRQEKHTIFFFFSSLFFFVLTLKSRRYVEYFVPYLIFFIAYSLTYLFTAFNWKKIIRELKNSSRIIPILFYLTVTLIVIFVPAINIKDVYHNYVSFKKGYQFDTYAGVSQYLKENSQHGEIIMHTDWDDFPHLFYHNSQNYYIVGLDPTFMYNYDRKLYQLYADITMAKINDNLSELIKDNFKAKYFIVQKGREALRQNLQKDLNFIKVYEDKDALLYMIK